MILLLGLTSLPTPLLLPEPVMTPLDTADPVGDGVETCTGGWMAEETTTGDGCVLPIEVVA